MKNFYFGVFTFKESIDYTNRHFALGFRISWKAKEFYDVYFLPIPKIYHCKWG